jgi:hypothetical protein
VGSCEHGNKHLCYIKVEELIHQLSSYKLLKEVSIPGVLPNNFLLIDTQEKFEVRVVVNMTMFFWVVTLCILRGRYGRFAETSFSPSSELKMAAFSTD